MSLDSWTAYAYTCDGKTQDGNDCRHQSPPRERIEDAQASAEAHGWVILGERSWCFPHRRQGLGE